MDIEPESIVPSSNISSRPRSLFWDGEKSLKDSESGLSYIQLQDRTLNILKVLSDRAKVNFQFLLQANAHGEELAPITIKRKGEHAQHHKEVRLSVTLYGPRDTAGDVGVCLASVIFIFKCPRIAIEMYRIAIHIASHSTMTTNSRHSSSLLRVLTQSRLENLSRHSFWQG